MKKKEKLLHEGFLYPVQKFPQLLTALQTFHFTNNVSSGFSSLKSSESKIDSRCFPNVTFCSKRYRKAGQFKTEDTEVLIYKAISIFFKVVHEGISMLA
jgi:hypothetical protein